jgi:5-methylcytosine-specific restriction endonuclease McrA
MQAARPNKKKFRIAAREQGGWFCHLCGREFLDPTQMTVDHLVAKIHGGSNDDSNLRLAHMSCNSERGHMPIDLYRMFHVIRRKFPHHVIDVFSRRRVSRENRQLGRYGMRLKPDE